MISQRARIQNALVVLGRKGTFLHAQYTDGLASELDKDGGKTAPESVVCNEQNSDFIEDDRHKRKTILRRSGWSFDLVMKFDREVDASLFEQDMMTNIPRISASGDLPYVDLHLTDAEYSHPPQQSSSNGSTITYTFEAVEGRR